MDVPVHKNHPANLGYPHDELEPPSIPRSLVVSSQATTGAAKPWHFGKRVAASLCASSLEMTDVSESSPNLVKVMGVVMGDIIRDMYHEIYIYMYIYIYTGIIRIIGY